MFCVSRLRRTTLLFERSSISLQKSIHSSTSTSFSTSKTLFKRVFSSTNSTEPPPSLFKRVLTLYSVLLGANFISNLLIHPTAKIDYGILNQFFPDSREVNSPFWGTRLAHLFLVPATLTFYDLTVTHLFTKYFGLISYSQTPTPWLLNIYIYTFLAIGSYVAIDSYFNPHHQDDKRFEHFTSHLRPLSVAMALQWHGGMVLEALGTTSPGLLGIIRNAFAVSLIFLPVKALGFHDCGEAGLTSHERKMNGLPPKSSHNQH